MEKTFEEIQAEFDNLTETFESLKAPVFNDESLHTMMAKHPLYEIEPFFGEHQNDFMDENEPSPVVFTTEDFNPETDQLYEFKVNTELRKAYYRREILGGNVSYDTAFFYSEEYYKSATIYINPDLKKSIKLAYLFIKDRMPYHYVECGPYGMLSKKYKSDGNRLLGYQQEHVGTGMKAEVEFSYNHEGALAQIVEINAKGASTLIFRRPEKNENIDDVLETIENALVEEISDQILEKVKISDQVYCILLEYTMQGAFPPTIGIGVTPDIEGDMKALEPYELFNAPDMQYFSEDETLDIDLYSTKLQEAYLFYNRAFENTSRDDDAYNQWQERVKGIYLRICKRLMHVDFSTSFSKTDSFLVMARDFEDCNEDEFYKEMIAYKREKGI